MKSGFVRVDAESFKRSTAMSHLPSHPLGELAAGVMSGALKSIRVDIVLSPRLTRWLDHPGTSHAWIGESEDVCNRLRSGTVAEGRQISSFPAMFREIAPLIWGEVNMRNNSESDFDVD
jgi:hypothetical protein